MEGETNIHFGKPVSPVFSSPTSKLKGFSNGVEEASDPVVKICQTKASPAREIEHVTKESDSSVKRNRKEENEDSSGDEHRRKKTKVLINTIGSPVLCEEGSNTRNNCMLSSESEEHSSSPVVKPRLKKPLVLPDEDDTAYNTNSSLCNLNNNNMESPDSAGKISMKTQLTPCEFIHTMKLSVSEY